MFFARLIGISSYLGKALRGVMAKVGLFYGSTAGNTAEGAEEIQKALDGNAVVETFDIADVEENVAGFS